MFPGHSTPASIFKNTSLKRDKESFRLSTAAISGPHATILRQENSYPVSSFHTRETLLPHQQYQRKSERKSFSKMTKIQEQSTKMENTNIYRSLLNNVLEQKNLLKEPYRANSHLALSYLCTGGIDQQQNQKYQMTESDNFPPGFIKKIYDEQKERLLDGNVNYHWGNLEKSGFLYFSIENNLILVNSLYYLQQQGITIEPIEIVLPKHALAVQEILIADFDIDDISLHPFGQRTLILMIWFPWQVGFYAFEPDSLCKFVDLDMRFDTSCQVGHSFDYSKKGQIFYMGQSGSIGKIDLFHENLWFFWSLKKYSVREYLYEMNSMAKRKYTKEQNQNIFEKIEQYYKNTKYFLSRKKTKGICMMIDRHRNFLYTLCQTFLKNKQGNKQVISHRQIKMYNIKKDCYKGTLEKIQKSYYNYPPKQERRFNQEQLYKEIGSNLFSFMPLQKFQIFSMCVIETTYTTQLFYKKNQINLLLILRNGTRISMHLSPQYFAIRSIVHIPNLEESYNVYKRTSELKGYLQPTLIQQKQPQNFRLVTWKYCQRQRSMVLMGVYNKRTVFILFTAGLGDQNQEQVQIMWEQNHEEKANIENMFVFADNYKVFLGGELERNMYKHKLSNYKYDQIEKRYFGNRTLFNKQFVEHVNVNKIKEGPQSRQVLHHPRQFLFIKENVITGIMKLRLVDVVIGVLQREISHQTQESINGLLMSDFELVHLYRKIVSALKFRLQDRRQKVELLAIFLQIFCDVDGVYFFNQFRISNMQRLNEGEGQKRRSSLLSNSLVEGKKGVDSYNFSRDGNQHSNGVNNANWRRRTSVKLRRNLKFIRCRRSELTVKQQFETMRLGNPIQGKGDHSVLKLIFKLMIFSVKNWGEDLGNFKRESEWIFKSFGQNEQLKCQQIEQAALKYVSRLISPIWSFRLKQISPSVFPYIADVCKNMIQLIKRIQNELVVNRIYYVVEEILYLLNMMMEYNNMLSLLSFYPDLRYGEGLGYQRRQFEESLFLSLEKQRDSSVKVYEWRKFIPNYFSHELFKAMKMQAEIKVIRDVDDRRNLIIQNRKIIPGYLINFYYRQGTITKDYIELLSKIYEKQNEVQNYKNAKIILDTNDMSVEQKVDYAFREICKNSVFIEEKQFLLAYANSNINNIRNGSAGEIQERKKILGQLTKTIRLQKIVSKQLIRLQKIYPDSQLSYRSKQLVNNCVLTTVQLKALIQKLNNPMIELCYYISFSEKEKKMKVSEKINQILDNKPNRRLDSKQALNKFGQVFKIFPRKDILKLPLLQLVEPFDELAFGEIGYDDLTGIVREDDSVYIKERFWVALFLADWGWDDMNILNYYMKKARVNFKRDKKFGIQKKFMYYWITAFTLVRMKFIDGRRQFRLFNEQILDESQANKQNIADYKLLQKFQRRKITA